MNATATPLSAADHEALARESWIDSATADAWGLHRVSSTEGAVLVGRTDRDDYAGMVFPMYWPGEARPRECFLRRDHPPMEQHNEQLKPKGKYLAPPGRGNRLLFGPGESPDALTDPAQPIVLVEGLKKTLAAWRLSRHDDSSPRFLVCGISGVWGWRGTIGKAPDATGARVDVKGTIPDLDRVTWTNRAVCVLFDSDAVTNPKVLAARRGLVMELQRRGAVVTAPDLPALEGLDKTGFDDLLAHWGPVRVLEWLASVRDTPPTAQEADMARLAALPPLEYGRARKEAAQRLGVPVAYLDAERDARRKADKKVIPGQGAEITFEDIAAAEDPVNGAALADRLSELFARFIVLPLYGERVLVLWVFFTYCYYAFEIAPRLDLRSPEKECGKTSVLGLLSRLVKRPLLSSGVTPPVIFRVISTYHPTLLIDEMDTFIDANEELRGILNSGHTKDAATIIRNVGDQHEPRMFSTWAPMAFAHIGPIPDTLEQRSIVLPMKRKKLSERVASLRQVGPAAGARRAEFRLFVSQLERWVTDEGPHLAEASPSIPDGLSGDRAADNWMPLLSIADALGGDWPEHARQAARVFSGQGAMENESIKVELLTDIQTLYARDAVDRLASSDLCGRLALLEERPWSEWKKGKPITPPQLARQLKPFHVSSRTVRFEGQGLSKGYLLEDFTDAFERYLPLPLQENPLFKRNNDTSRAQSGDDPLFQSVTGGACYVSENGLIPAPRAECVSVTARKGDFGGEETLFEKIPDRADPRPTLENGIFDAGDP